MTAIPDGFPTSAEHWYGRWLAAQEQLDEEGAQRIAGWPRAAAAERERIAQLADRNEAVCTGDEGTSCYFADVIRGSTANCENRT